MMLRTQIYLPEEYHHELAIIAHNLGVPKAVVIRKILKKALKNKEELIGGGNDLLALSKLKIKGGPKDLSAKLDSYLYG